MWDPRLMCLKECLHFTFRSAGGWGYVVLTRFVSFFVQDFVFCKWQYQWSVPLLPSRVSEVAKAATLWLFSHGVGGAQRHGGRGGNISNTQYVEFVRACVHVMSTEQSQRSLRVNHFVEQTERSVYHEGSSSCSETSRWFSVNSCKQRVFINRQNPLRRVGWNRFSIQSKVQFTRRRNGGALVSDAFENTEGGSFTSQREAVLRRLAHVVTEIRGFKHVASGLKGVLCKNYRALYPVTML